ncbi:MAG: hypothetical protein ACYS5V_11525 [Planctomycetota bacterium]|jgi:hypothetical protein
MKIETAKGPVRLRRVGELGRYYAVHRIGKDGKTLTGRTNVYGFVWDRDEANRFHGSERWGWDRWSRPGAKFRYKGTRRSRAAAVRAVVEGARS